jgi:hypothetical protein
MTTTQQPLQFGDYTVTEWGNPTWRFLHVYAGTYPLDERDVTPEFRAKFTQLVTLIMELLPCEHPCRPEAVAYLKRTPLTAQVMRNRQTLSQYIVDFHNFVNGRTGKPAWTMQRAIEHHRIPLPLQGGASSAVVAVASHESKNDVKRGQHQQPAAASRTPLAPVSAPLVPVMEAKKRNLTSIATPASAARQVPFGHQQQTRSQVPSRPPPYYRPAVSPASVSASTAIAVAGAVGTSVGLAAQPAAGIVTKPPVPSAAATPISRNPLAMRLLTGRRV